MNLKITIIFALAANHVFAQDCVDSPLNFKFPGKNEPYNCESAVKKYPSLCDEPSVNTHCPVMCQVSNCAATDSAMRFDTLIKQGDEYNQVWKSCSWVKQSNTCHKCSKYGVKETCPDACKDCRVCQDSPLNFKYRDEIKNCRGFVSNSENVTATCELGSEEYGYISSHCPDTCGVEDCGGQESEMQFEILLEKDFDSGNYEYRFKQCEWVLSSETEELCLNRCARNGVSETCPESCSQCGDV